MMHDVGDDGAHEDRHPTNPTGVTDSPTGG